MNIAFVEARNLDSVAKNLTDSERDELMDGIERMARALSFEPFVLEVGGNKVDVSLFAVCTKGNGEQ